MKLLKSLLGPKADVLGRDICDRIGSTEFVAIIEYMYSKANGSIVIGNDHRIRLIVMNYVLADFLCYQLVKSKKGEEVRQVLSNYCAYLCERNQRAGIFNQFQEDFTKIVAAPGNEKEFLTNIAVFMVDKCFELKDGYLLISAMEHYVYLATAIKNSYEYC